MNIDTIIIASIGGANGALVRKKHVNRTNCWPRALLMKVDMISIASTKTKKQALTLARAQQYSTVTRTSYIRAC